MQQEEIKNTKIIGKPKTK